MSKNGHLRLTIPPGYVDARCLTCPADVIIPDGTLKCPNGDHDVEPTSLPRMPKPAVVPAIPSMPMELVATSERPIVPAPPRQVVVQAESVPKDVEPVVLPDVALAWHADTEALRAQLLADETRLAEQLRRTRQTRKLLDAVLGRVMAPELSPSDSVLEVVPDLVSDAAVEARPPESVAASEASAAPASGPFRCLNPNCGTPEARHAAKGRCSRCYMYWKAHGSERPRDLPQRGGIHVHG